MGGRAFHAHKNVLGARSCYFLTMFTSSFKESWEKEISIDGNAEVFERLLDFMYTGSADLKLEIAGEFLEMACYMQITKAAKACSQFINTSVRKGLMSMDDVVRMYHLAKCLGFKDVVACTYDYICNCHLKDLKSSVVFLETIDNVFLQTVLMKTTFSSEKEEKEVFEMIINWLKYDWENRCVHSAGLLQLVRLGQVPEEKLIELMDEDILGIPECKLLLDQTLEALHSTCSKYQRIKQLPNLFATRSTVTRPVAIGHELNYYGNENDRPTKLSTVWTYDKRWGDVEIHHLRPLPYIPSLIIVDEQLYAAGGYETVDMRNMEEEEFQWRYRYDEYRSESNLRSQRVNNFSRYNMEFNQWDKLPPMKDDRDDFPLVHLDGFLYAIGGVGQKGKTLNQVERFDLKDLCWERQAPLPEGYKWVSAVPYQGAILAYGLKESTHVIAMNDPEANAWHIKSKLKGSCHVSYRNDKYPMLFVHKDVCYRVLFQQPTEEQLKKLEEKLKDLYRYLLRRDARCPVVNRVDVQAMATNFCNCPNHPKKNTRVSIGEEIKQDRIPANKVGAFRIEDEVFVSLNRYVHLTDISAQGDQEQEVSLGRWDDFFWKANTGRKSNIVNLTYDPVPR